MNYKLKRSLLLLSIPATLYVSIIAGFTASASAQMTDEEIYSRMEGSNLPPGYFDPEPSFSFGDALCIVRTTGLCAFSRVLQYPNSAGSWLETNPNDPADSNGDAMKDSSYPYLPGGWRDTDNDGMPDQSYDPSYPF